MRERRDLPSSVARSGHFPGFWAMSSENQTDTIWVVTEQRLWFAAQISKLSCVLKMHKKKNWAQVMFICEHLLNSARVFLAPMADLSLLIDRREQWSIGFHNSVAGWWCFKLFFLYPSESALLQWCVHSYSSRINRKFDYSTIPFFTSIFEYIRLLGYSKSLFFECGHSTIRNAHHIKSIRKVFRGCWLCWTSCLWVRVFHSGSITVELWEREWTLWNPLPEQFTALVAWQTDCLHAGRQRKPNLETVRATPGICLSNTWKLLRHHTGIVQALSLTSNQLRKYSTATQCSVWWNVRNISRNIPLFQSPKEEWAPLWSYGPQRSPFFFFGKPEACSDSHVRMEKILPD